MGLVGRSCKSRVEEFVLRQVRREGIFSVPVKGSLAF